MIAGRGREGCPPRPDRERGMVTAELAVGILTALVVALAACWGIGIGVQQVVTGDVAAQVARLHGRGDAAAAAAVVGRVPGASVQVEASGGFVTVRAEVVGKPWGSFPAFTTRATATAVLETVA